MLTSNNIHSTQELTKYVSKFIEAKGCLSPLYDDLDEFEAFNISV